LTGHAVRGRAYQPAPVARGSDPPPWLNILVGSAGGVGTARHGRLVRGASRRRFEPCVQFSRTRLSDTVHRLACAGR
jgi:hypothetical protein